MSRMTEQAVPQFNELDGIEVGCGLDGRGSIPVRRKIFFPSTASRPALGPTQPPIQWVPEVLFPEGKAAEA
jgi:hypothetical protein